MDSLKLQCSDLYSVIVLRPRPLSTLVTFVNKVFDLSLSKIL